jgi:hypothetical protein
MCSAPNLSDLADAFYAEWGVGFYDVIDEVLQASCGSCEVELTRGPTGDPTRALSTSAQWMLKVRLPNGRTFITIERTPHRAFKRVLESVPAGPASTALHAVLARCR